MARKYAGSSLSAREFNAVVASSGRLDNISGQGVKVSSSAAGVSVAVSRPKAICTEPAIAVLALNDDTVDLSAYAPCGITGHVQEGDEAEYHRALKVRAPLAADEGRWGITAEPIAAGAVGRVYISGACLAMVTDPDEKDFAEISEGAGLIGADTGSAQILWEGNPASADPQLAIIRFPFGGAAADVVAAKCATTANHGLTGTASVDGVTIAAGSHVLVWKQSTASQNGLYSVTASGTWVKIGQPSVVFVLQGTANKLLTFLLNSANTYKAGYGVYAA